MQIVQVALSTAPLPKHVTVERVAMEHRAHLRKKRRIDKIAHPCTSHLQRRAMCNELFPLFSFRWTPQGVGMSSKLGTKQPIVPVEYFV